MKDKQASKFVPIAGDLSQGAAIDRASAGERVLIPQNKIDVGEIIFRVRATIEECCLETDDLLIVEPRNAGHAASGELVVAIVEGRAFIGHWWEKRGTRALMDDDLAVIIEHKAIEILGAINLIVRTVPPSTRMKRSS
jgi:SOS-response transcriptional repressor LexA